ncbi:AEC family transporter [Sphingomonas sp. RP10(2022)]|uniref:AEC family transporter n=1 Tax=Sphingomonas liriopis TaxID=2949094 RepID=A0A9X2HYV3_9SPHN|nr:AEC family transporter [Sphingomonas liriopis]
MTVLATILPIFALILAGFVFARARGLGDETVRILNTYVVWLALPALLFDFVAEADWATLAQPRFTLVFATGMLATFGLSYWASPRIASAPRSMTRRALDALTASYANTAYMGIPIAHGLLGEQGLAAAVIASLLTVCALFAFAVMWVEVDLDRGGSRSAMVARVGGSVLRNPIVAAPVAGAMWALTGFAMPEAATAFLTMLGGSATPVALVTIGVFLAQRRGRGARTELGFAVACKLLVQPLVTLAALAVLPLTRPYAAAALIIAALPTGTGPFMVAELYRQEVMLTSRAILVSTLLSLVTVSAVAWWALG